MKNLKCNYRAKKVYRIEDVQNHFQAEFGLYAEWHVIKQSALLNAPKTKSKQLYSLCKYRYVICLPTEHQRVHKNSFRNASAFQNRIGIWKCWFLKRGENRSTRRKTSRSRVENQQQTQPTYDAGSSPRHVGGRRALSLLCHLCSPGTTEENRIDHGQPRRAGGPYGIVLCTLKLKSKYQTIPIIVCPVLHNKNKMVTGTFTHNSQRAKTLTTHIPVV